jgi:hypothetical protein
VFCPTFILSLHPETNSKDNMVKNWLILGDEAFDSTETPLGIFKFTLEEMKDWQSIAWKQFANVVNNNEIVNRMVFGCNRISLSGLFYKKSGVVLEHLNDFARAIASECDNLEYGDAEIEYDTSKDTNMLFISFFYYDPELVNTNPIDFNFIRGDTIIPVQVNSDCMYS